MAIWNRTVFADLRIVTWDFYLMIVWQNFRIAVVFTAEQELHNTGFCHTAQIFSLSVFLPSFNSASISSDNKEKYMLHRNLLNLNEKKVLHHAMIIYTQKFENLKEHIKKLI